MTVEPLQPAHEASYDAFVRSQPESLFYHSWTYRAFLKALIGCDDEYLVAVDDGRIRGVLPLMRVAGPGGRVYNSLPFFGTSAGIIAADAPAYRALADAYNAVARRPDTVSATIVGSQFGPREDADRLAYTHTDPRIAQWTPLPQPGHAEEQLLSRIDASARRNISKARRSGVTVTVDAGQMRRLCALHAAGMNAIGGTAKPARFFELVPRFFTAGRDFDVYVARVDDGVVAALLLFYHGRTVEYFVPAVDPSHRSRQPLSLLVATAMTDAARRGFSWWNWGGTWVTQTGVYRFKRKWGAIERTYAFYTQLNDDALRHWPRERVLATWPHFFVLPFAALVDSGVNRE